ncbi:MAG: DUF4363 family protein [Ruminococcaceae bacterium]|nr:DUF4363 family protein [Oscillospiraceae bacterium]
MKIFLSSLLILVLTITGGVMADSYLSNVAKEIDEYCKTISELPQESEEVYKKAYNEMNEYWQNKKKTLSVIIDHAYIGDIDKALSEMEAAINTDEHGEMFLSLARIKTTIDMVAQNEHFHLNSIL